MSKVNELDFALSDLQVRNKVLLGIIDSLTDTMDQICSPITGDQNSVTEEQQSMALYGLLRDKNSIDSLLYSLKHFTNDQDKQLYTVYNKFVTYSEVKGNVQ